MSFLKGHKINLGRKFKESRNKKIGDAKCGIPKLKARLKLKGKKFGRLIVLGFTRMKNGYTYWLCKCNCGKEVEVEGSLLNTGITKSCGCLGIENRRKATFKHGMRDEPFYKNWCSMRYRCYKKNNISYKNYGAKGIKVCKRWQKFINFKDDMFKGYLEHLKKYGRKNTTIERLNSSKDYSADNCIWATRLEQNSNTNRNVFIEFKGEKLTMSGWARKIGVDRSTILYRVFEAKWPLERALKK